MSWWQYVMAWVVIALPSAILVGGMISERNREHERDTDA